MKKRVSDIIMDSLVEYGIRNCFCVVGGGSMYLDSSLGKKKELVKVFNHHEQACAMAAEAYSKVNGDLACVIVTSGPGATNTLTGVMGAWQDSLPLLVLSGQVRTDLSVEKTGLPLRFRGAQEFDITNSIKNMTKYCKRVTDPFSIKAELRKAIQIATTGRRGPVWLDIPLDIQMIEIEIESLYEDSKNYSFVSDFDYDDVDYLQKKLSAAKRPVILVGNGVGNSGIIQEFRILADTLNVPVIAAAQASDVMYRENSNYYGIAGIIGWRSGNFVLQNADLILAIGTSLGFKTTGYAQEKFAPNAEIIMIDADENEHKKPGIKVDKFFHADVRDVIQLWLKKVEPISIERSWRNYCNSVKSRFDVYEAVTHVDKDDRVSSYYFWKIYDRLASEDNVSILGNNTGISSRVQIGTLKQKQRTMTNDNCGSMGYDIPASIGAAMATGKEIICVTGDGSIMMNLQELQTIKHYDLPIKIVIFANDGYNALRQTWKNFFNNEYAGCDKDTGVSFPRFEAIAKAFDFQYKHCKTNLDIEESLEWLFSCKNQAILEVDQKYDDPVTPKIMSRIDENGNFVTPELHDMYPFLEKEELNSLMINDEE